MGRFDAVAVLEAAYDLDCADEAWLRGIDAAAALRLQGDRGRLIGEYALHDRGWSLLASSGDEDTHAFFSRAARLAPLEGVRFFVTQPQIHASFSQVVGAFDADIAEFWADYRTPEFSIGDFKCAQARDGGSRVVLMASLHAEPVAATAAEQRLWTALAGHVAAAHRLRRALGGTRLRSEDGEALIETNGRVAHARGAGRRGPALERLRTAARALDAARTRAGRAEPDEALSMWSGLVDGRWTLVDRFDTDGRRYFVAIANAPAFEQPAALSARERQVAQQAAQGMSSKVIGYNLGLRPSTVSTHLTSALRKMRLDSVTDLPWLLQDSTPVLASGDPLELRLKSVGLEVTHPQLTPAEREVASLAAGGLTDREIAEARRTSVSTVANQLRAVFATLGVQSRLELVERLARTNDY